MTLRQCQNAIGVLRNITYGAQVFYVYILRCRDNSLYVGHTDDLDARLAAHRSRRYCGYTAKRLPVHLIFQNTFPTREEAFAAQRQIKGWTRAK